jgi:hypothetical protein
VTKITKYKDNNHSLNSGINTGMPQTFPRPTA